MTRNQNTKNAVILLIILVVLVVSGALITSAQEPDNASCYFGNMFGGMDMMGGVLPENCAQQGLFSMGMMGGMMGHMDGMMMGGMMGFDVDARGQFGPGTGMMGAWTPSTDLTPADDALTLDEAVEVAKAYIEAWDSEQPLTLGEVMQFDNHFYGLARETETGLSAFEFLIDPATGTVFGEPGPNMMWNLRYGTSMGQSMGMFRPQGNGDELSIDIDEAQSLAQTYLDEVLPGTQVDEETDTFYGYYTLHVLRDGETVGMLGVNGYSGQVWLHHWHGDFIDMTGHD
jgi:hypothetical protein